MPNGHGHNNVQNRGNALYSLTKHTVKTRYNEMMFDTTQTKTSIFPEKYFKITRTGFVLLFFVIFVIHTEVAIHSPDAETTTVPGTPTGDDTSSFTSLVCVFDSLSTLYFSIHILGSMKQFGLECAGKPLYCHQKRGIPNHIASHAKCM